MRFPGRAGASSCALAISTALSEILFIATANEWTRIPPPLPDRLEVIKLPGYTEAEKVAIATTQLVPATEPLQPTRSERRT